MHQPSDSVTLAFRTWMADLVDLTIENPLLHFRPDRNSLRLVVPSASDLLKQFMAADSPRQFRLDHGATAHETGVIVGRDADGAEGTVLRTLRQRARLAIEEQGVHILYVTFGNLKWTFRDGSAVDSPILILPVSLNRATAIAHYTLSPAERHPDLSFNPALATTFKQEYGVDLHNVVGGGATSLDDVLEAVRDAIADHFEWVANDDSFLTLLPFSKFALHEDLDRHRDEFLRHPVIRGIAGDLGAIESSPQESSDLRPTDEDGSWQVLDADATQRAAIASVHRGDSIVIQGPPGTGKSQSIANIIAETLGRGKTVLFVSEKKAALNVVAQRLAAVGLDEFCLELHDEALNEAAVLKELARSTGMGMPRDEELPPLLEQRAASADTSALAEIRRELDAYYEALCTDTTPFGGSSYDLIGQLADLADAPEVRFDFDPARSGSLTRDRLGEFERILEDLRQIAPIVVEPDTHPWRHVDPAKVQADPVTRYRLGERLKEITAAAGTLLEDELTIRKAWGLPPGSTLEAARSLQGLLVECAERGPVPALPAWFEQATYIQATGLAADHGADRGRIQARRENVLTRFESGMFDEHLIGLLDKELQTVSSGILEPDSELVEGTVPQPLIQVPARFAAALVLAALETSTELGIQIAERFGLRQAGTVDRLHRTLTLTALVEQGKPPRREWFPPERHADLRSLATQARDHARVLSGRAEFLTRFRPRIFDLAGDSTIDDMENPPENILEGTIDLIRLIRVEGLHQPPARLDRAQVAEALRKAHSIRQAERWFAEHVDDLDREFGLHDTGPATDWNALLDVLAAVEASVDLIDPTDPPAALVDFPAQLTRRDDLMGRFRHSLELLDTATTMLKTVAPRRLDPLIATLRTRPIEDLEAELRTQTLRGYTSLVEIGKTLTSLRLQPWTSFSELVEDVAGAAKLNREEDELRQVFGRHYAGEATNWFAIAESLAWIGLIRAHFGIGDPPIALVERVIDETTLAAENGRGLATDIAQLEAAVERLEPFFVEGALVRSGQIETLALPDIARWTSTLAKDLSGMERWLFSLQALDEANSLGMLPFVEAVRQAGTPAERWVEAFGLQVRTLWLTWRLRNTPALARFVLIDPDARRARFAALDQAQLAANAVRLASELRARRTRALAEPARKPETAKLRRLASAAVQHPMRDLFTEASALIEALTPCFLMSPTTVARLLGESPLRFDVVIFDEASQVLPQDAIGSIGRGRQLVVVGDSEQLPPTSFFKRAAIGGEWKPQSLLDACAIAGLNDSDIMLLWHYRSRHEDLIAFSNKEFYENRLVTFPSPHLSEDPIDFEHVRDGVYDRGGSRANRIEASRLVDLVVEQARREPELSIGIITFSEAQMIVVQEELDARRRLEPELETQLAETGSEGLFVRNLENVQGDERDAIFMSVGYGPDRFGKMSLHFGPVNGEGGPRRLNVAVTRARRKMTILTSFDPEELRASENDGIQTLYRYLQHARRGAPERRVAAHSADSRNEGFAAAVAKALRRAGLHVERNAGTGRSRIDLAIRDEASADRYVLGIVCDGSIYANAPDARDRERLWPQVLTGLGWRIHHIWSMAWQNDPDHELKRILDLVDQARAAAPATPPAPAASPSTGTDRSTLELGGASSGDSDGDGFTIAWGAGGDEPETPPVRPEPTPPPVVTPAPEPELTPPPVVEPASEPEPTPPPVVPAESEPEPISPPVVTQTPEPEPTTPPVVTQTPEPEPIPPPVVTRTPEPTTTPPARPPKRGTKPSGTREQPTPPGGKGAVGATKLAQPLDEIKGLTASAKRALLAAKIETLGALLKQTASDKKRRDLAKRLGVEPSQLTDWVNRANLMRITGIGAQFANLLEICGVASCKELQHRVPTNLLATLQEVNAERKLAKRLPTLPEIESWVDQAAEIVATDAPGRIS